MAARALFSPVMPVLHEVEIMSGLHSNECVVAAMAVTTLPTDN